VDGSLTLPAGETIELSPVRIVIVSNTFWWIYVNGLIHSHASLDSLWEWAVYQNNCVR
jgi:hypothetical protein